MPVNSFQSLSIFLKFHRESSQSSSGQYKYECATPSVWLMNSHYKDNMGQHPPYKHLVLPIDHKSLGSEEPTNVLETTYTLGKKGCYTPIEDNKTNVDRTFVSTWLKLAWYGPVIVPQRNPTLPWADIQCKVKWDRRAPKPQYRW